MLVVLGQPGHRQAGRAKPEKAEQDALAATWRGIAKTKIKNCSEWRQSWSQISFCVHERSRKKDASYDCKNNISSRDNLISESMCILTKLVYSSHCALIEMDEGEDFCL